MQKSELAKTSEHLENTPPDIQIAMDNYIDYYNLAREMKIDICERLDSPVLWAAIQTLLEYEEKKAEAHTALRSAGYTLDDAFKWTIRENQKYRKEIDIVGCIEIPGHARPHAGRVRRAETVYH